MPDRICSIDDCERPHYARGWCKLHYSRWWVQLPPKRPRATCSIDGCNEPIHGHGWCGKHYRRWQRHGDPRWQPASSEDRFWNKVDQSGECWIWTAGLFPQGYGQFKMDGHPVGAHRVAYELLVGPIPEGLDLDHRCHSEAVARGECYGGDSCPHRACVNPAHLEPVTCGENIRRGLTGRRTRTS